VPFEIPATVEATTVRSDNFTSVVTAIRWATTAAALLVLSTGAHTDGDALAGAIVLTLALWRTIRPVDVTHGLRPAFVGILSEAAVVVTAVVATGHWSSPYVLGIFTVVSLAGFSGGMPASLPVAAACVVAIAVPYHLSSADADFRLTVQWAGEIALVATVTGYARRITLRASAETTAFLTRLQQLSEANGLLLQLHRVASTLPMSLDLSETLDSSANRLRDLFEPEVMVILVRDESAQWMVVHSKGVNLGTRLRDADLPPALAAVATGEEQAPHLVESIKPGAGLEAGSTSGIYAPLWVHQELVGLVAVERGPADPLAAPQVALMEAFAEQMAVAIDNARWFSRIGTLAAERERSRIARDLHDSVGQSLALVGFELDRAAKTGSEEEIRSQVLALRETVRSIVGELRETLHDLRTDVSEECSMSRVLDEFVDRVGRRSKLRISLESEADRRLPLAVEREIWRIAQEAITNVERHAEATTLTVVWATDDESAMLRVTDDGKGMPSGDHRRPGGYGLLGMQERADAIGATLTVSSAPGTGTDVRIVLLA